MTRFPRSIKAKKALAEAIFDRLCAQNPEPKGELNWTNPYTLLVAVTLSAQATDKGVNKATKSLFEVINHPNDLLTLGEAGLIAHIKSIGLYRSKAKNLIKMAEILVNDYDGIVPQSREALESLPGVGRKTANVVLSIAFGQSTLAIDTHLFRLAHRFGLSKGKTPLKVEEDLLTLIHERHLYHAHQWLILHGRYICKAQKPNCSECCLNDLCPSAET